VHLDEGNSNVVGVAYSSPVIALPRPCDPTQITAPFKFNTRVKVPETLFAMSIPVQAMGPKPPHLAKLNLEAAEEGVPGATAPKPKSFLERYVSCDNVYRHPLYMTRAFIEPTVWNDLHWY
jgi:hypothetical protein